MGTPLVQSVMRALFVLDELVKAAESEGDENIALSELSRRSELRPNTLHNLLRSLIAAGYAESGGDGRYRIGPKCRQMGMQNKASAWIEFVKPIVDDLIIKTGESALFCSLAGTERLIIYQNESDEPVRATHSTPGHRHFYSVATSRVLAACSSETVREALLIRWGTPGKEFNNADSTEVLNAVLDKVRDKGYARCLTHGDEVVNLAVPVFDNKGKL
ncbi:MAG: helix-turn-helix domain-containing protein, partial [Lentisphaerae bacterium]|nr:helix-turn-helix domain-containing protein [Lentisphaerota bacterium]